MIDPSDGLLDLPHHEDGGTQRKLHTLSERFTTFERQVDADLRAKKHSETADIEAIKGSLVRLEQTLEAEISRRVEAHKAQQNTLEVQLQSSQDKLEASFLERYDHLHSIIDALGDRMQSVEKDFVQSRERYIRDMEERSELVNKDVANLALEFAGELEERKDREAAMVQKIRAIEAKTDEKIDREAQICDDKYNQLSEDFEASKRAREEASKRFQACATAELSTVNDGLAKEATTRQRSDDDIVTALNHYTKSLQDALHMVSQQRLSAATLRAGDGPKAFGQA